LLDPTILFRRRSIGILVRFLIGSGSRKNRILQKEVSNVFRLFNERDVRACIFGSLAISLHAGWFVKNHSDIDLILPNEADTNRAVRLLVDELDYRTVRRHDWTGLKGERCFHVALHAPSGVSIELSCVPENPRAREHIFVVDGVPVRIADLRGLRNTYALFLVTRGEASDDVDRQSKKNAILIVDQLLSAT
jgi:hypothetical protein